MRYDTHETGDKLALNCIPSSRLLPSIPSHVQHLLGGPSALDGAEGLSKDRLATSDPFDEVPRLVTGFV